MTWDQKEGGIKLSPWNHDRWLSPQRTHEVKYVFSSWWSNQELKLEIIKVKPLKFTTPKHCTCILFVDTNRHLTTKPLNFYIKCQAIMKAMINTVFFGQSLEVVRTFNLGWDFFQPERLQLDILLTLLLEGSYFASPVQWSIETHKPTRPENLAWSM